MSWQQFLLRLVVGCFLVLSGCDDFPTPAELSHPQILAIRAEPPAVSPGQSTTLSLLVADQSGVVMPDSAWELTESTPGQPLLGEVVAAEDNTAIYTAPDMVSREPTIASVMVRVSTPERVLSAIKAIPIGEGLGLSNPEVTALRIDGSELTDDSALVLSPGQEVALEIESEPAATSQTTFAWYSTGGTIERYQSNPTAMLVRDEPGEGWLIVVVRNGLGGVGWKVIRLSVE